MNNTQQAYLSKLQRKLDEGKFAITCEIGPPKGADQEEIKESASYLKDLADGINVTDLQSSVMRMGSLTTCTPVSYTHLDVYKRQPLHGHRWTFHLQKYPAWKPTGCRR